MITVGIIANPASGKDIRRLVAHGSVFDNDEKVSIVRRALLGLESVGVARVLIMPDSFGIGQKALDGIRPALELVPLAMPLTFRQEDSRRAAELMAAAGVGCIITLGGDGTNRAVAKGCGDVPLMPVSTGTNNVFPILIEGTVAGMAAGLVARGLADAAVRRMPRLDVFHNPPRSPARGAEEQAHTPTTSLPRSPARGAEEQAHTPTTSLPRSPARGAEEQAHTPTTSLPRSLARGAEEQAHTPTTPLPRS